MSSHPMVDLTLSRINQEALLEKGKRLRDLRLANGGPENVVPVRESVVLWLTLHIRNLGFSWQRESNETAHLNSLDLDYPNRHRW